MNLSARRAVVACLGLALAGCAATTPARPAAQQEPRRDQGVRPATVTVVGRYHAAGQDWRLVSFTDPTGAYCIAVDGRDQGIPACDLESDTRHPVNAAMQAMDDHLVVAYGVVDPSVRKMHAVVAGQDEAVEVDSRTGVRCFAVFMIDGSTTDIVATTADGTRFSLKSDIDDFYAPD